MGAIRACVAAPDSQPWEAQDAESLLSLGLIDTFRVIMLFLKRISEDGAPAEPPTQSRGHSETQRVPILPY